MRKLDSNEAAMVERLINVLESDNPTTEELTITLEISPEDIIERFPDRIYDLREKIVDTKIIFGDPDEVQEEGDTYEADYPDEEYQTGDDFDVDLPPWEEEQVQSGRSSKRARD